MSSLEKYPFSSCANFLIGLLVFLLLSHVSCWCILEIKPLLVTLLAHFFFLSQSIDCLFLLFMVSFAVQELISFIRSHFCLFLFLFLCLGTLI